MSQMTIRRPFRELYLCDELGVKQQQVAHRIAWQRELNRVWSYRRRASARQFAIPE